MNVNDLKKGRPSTMFTVEFESDASVVTTIDQSQTHEDIEMVYANNGVVYIRQWDELDGSYQLVYMSHQQWQDLLAGYKSPEGAYSLTNKRKVGKGDE
jgi:hypothetical protein